jgi:bifunctional oligoribonuclease and PAP phosphatase NrnA
MPIDDRSARTLVDLLNTRRTFVLVPHERADGDALGSMLALARGLELHGKTAIPVLLSDVSERYRFLFADRTVPILGRDLAIEAIPDHDAMVLLDTGVRQQLQPILPLVDRPRGTLVVIDHHEHCDLRCDLAFRDEASPATGLLVAAVLSELGWLADARMAEYLLIAIASDTGWFSYSNTTARCFEWAARLTDLGARPQALHKKLFLSDSLPRFRLMARTLAAAEVRSGGRLVVLTIRGRDFQSCGADEAHTENLIDQACRLQSMQVAALLVEQPNGVVRISLRCRDPFDVHAFAARYGGGGHRHAAGMKIQGTFDEVKTEIVRALETTVEKE